MKKEGSHFLLCSWVLLWFHLCILCEDRQHLLWMGSDPFFTLLLLDWFGSNVIAGAGAIFSCVCRSCMSTAFRIRELLRKNNLPSPHLRAISILPRAETIFGWIFKNPIQRIRTITLQEKQHIFLHLKRNRRENKCFVCGYTLAYYLPKEFIYKKLVSHL